MDGSWTKDRVLRNHQIFLSTSRPANPFNYVSWERLLKTLKWETPSANYDRDLKHPAERVEVFIERSQ